MRLFALGCILAVVLSGCGGKSTDGGDTTGNDVTTGVVSSHGTGTPGNHPPDGALRPSTVAGPVPLVVNFTLDGTDRDQDPLTWTFDADHDGKADKSGKGTELPATFSYTYKTTGSFNATYKLSDPQSTVTFSRIIGVGAPVGGGGTLFIDDAEGDAGKWTIMSEVVVNTNLPAGPGPTGTGQEHPAGPWAQVSDQFHLGAKSWHAHYPDNYYSSMTVKTAITVPPGGALVSFWLKGAAEDNGYDGVYVNSGPSADALENQVYQAKAIEDWKQFFYPVPEGPLVLQFVFAADISCSSEPAPTGGPVACGAGYDGGGFWVDDIQVG
ncbi:MAG: hypothetical protein V4510_12250 [bacterium]